jgi:CRP-like cAMP-binding protein
MEAVPMDLKHILYQPNERIKYVYFPINGAVSLLAIMKDGTGAEVGIVEMKAWWDYLYS